MKHVLLLAAATAVASIAFAQQPKKSSNDTFLKRNPDARSLHWQDSGNRIIVDLKSGKREVYDLNVESQRLAVIEKYGVLPEAPPPPPPPVGAPPPPPVPDNIDQPPGEIEPLQAIPPAPPSVHKKAVPVSKKATPPPPPAPKKEGPHYN